MDVCELFANDANILLVGGQHISNKEIHFASNRRWRDIKGDRNELSISLDDTMTGNCRRELITGLGVSALSVTRVSKMSSSWFFKKIIQ